MNEVAKDILAHYGIKRRSGRYPWGSGKDPYQHGGDFLARVEQAIDINSPVEGNAPYRYGVKKRLGKYPWGDENGDYKTSEDFLKQVEAYRKEKITYTDPETGETYSGETAVSRMMGMDSTSEFRLACQVAISERRRLEVDRVKSLKSDGYSNSEIARIMGKNESTIRSLLDENREANMNAAKNTADFLREQINEKGIIDVGIGVEKELGITRNKLDEALYMLEAEGYPIYGRGISQVTNPNQQTTLKLICPPGTQWADTYDETKINSITEYASKDDGETFATFQYPASMDSSRIKILLADEAGLDGYTGSERDGLIEIRRGVKDLDLGDSAYAQVRILVDNDKYMKGVAVYSDNIPDGYDVVFNSSKQDYSKALKEIKDDPDNPFGSLIKANGQSTYIDDDGNEQLSLINKTREEGEWGEWSKTLPSQFLSKQPQALVKKQLDLSIAEKQSQYEDILNYPNPTIRKALLEEFASDCDSTAVDLDAASLPRQKYQVILPVPSLKDNEVYAPNYNDGEQVALVRFPHGGTFEIPIVTVNNKNQEAIDILGKNALDAVAVNKNVANILSGADFDGDTVMVIPVNSNVKIQNKKPFENLKDFDNKIEYGTEKRDDGYYRNGEKITVMTKRNTQMEMGIITNLITDMTLKGATDDELERAVRHSMVVIDAEKHHLDYKASEKDNGIDELKRIYQKHTDDDGYGGASTIISRAKSEKRIDIVRYGSPDMNEMKKTGKLKYKEGYETYTDKDGKTRVRQTITTKMAEADDAFDLVSDRELAGPIEVAYANYANTLKSMANDARKTMANTKDIPYSPAAKEVYSNEVQSLSDKLTKSELNAPRERKAQILAKAVVKAKEQDNPTLSKEEKGKIRQQALTNARNKVGAQREPIHITDSEWEAIQAGAISKTKLKQIIKYVDSDELKSRALPRSTTTLTSAKQARLTAMLNSGYTNKEIADALNVSESTIINYIKEGRNS